MINVAWFFKQTLLSYFYVCEIFMCMLLLLSVAVFMFFKWDFGWIHVSKIRLYGYLYGFLSFTHSGFLFLYCYSLFFFLYLDCSWVPYQAYGLTNYLAYKFYSWTRYFWWVECYGFSSDCCLRQLFRSSFLHIFKLHFVLDSIAMLFVLLLMFLIPVCYSIHLFSSNVNEAVKFNYLTDSSVYVDQKELLNLMAGVGSSQPSNIKMRANNNFSLKMFNYRFCNIFNGYFFINLLFLQVVLFTLFAVSDILGFFILFESSMIPLYFSIGLFGSRNNRVHASYYLFFFTLLGGIFFLVALVIIYHLTKSSDLFILMNFKFYKFNGSFLLWWFIFIPMAIKVPILPFHVWLPEAHVEASTEGSVLLAGLLLKIGLFGMYRFLIPIFPYASNYFFPAICTIALVGIMYISCLIFTQLDVKKIIAYSSIIHMNFALLGLFSNSVAGVQGAIYLMFTHGITSSGLFVVAGAVYSRVNTRLIPYMQGLKYDLPLFSTFFFLFLLSNAGVPGTGGFIGEFLIIIGLFERNAFVAAFSLIGPLFAVLYSFLLFSRIFFGAPSFKNFVTFQGGVVTQKIYAETQLEVMVLSVFAFFVIQTGCFPNLYLATILPSVLYFLA